MKKKQFIINGQKTDDCIDMIVDVILNADLNPRELIYVAASISVMSVFAIRKGNLIEDVDKDSVERKFIEHLQMCSRDNMVHFDRYTNLEPSVQEDVRISTIIKIMNLLRTGKITTASRNVDVIRMVCAVDKEAS